MQEKSGFTVKPRVREAGRRSGVSLSAESLVRTGLLRDGELLPALVEPAAGPIDLKAWASGAHEQIDELLLEHGGVLFRGFELGGVEAFQDFIQSLSQEVLDYVYRSTPRSEVSGKIYTSTEYPADQEIPMHNEMSYTRSWPRKIWFYSVVAAEGGGETPIADSRKVYAALDPELRQRFADLGVMYVRNYGTGVDLSWQEVFQTEDRAEVEAFCRRSDMEFEWLGGDRLRTRQVCQAVAKHPRTGDDLWFNQAHLFHASSLPSEAREFLLEELGPENLPRNTFYGDGSPIADETLDQVRHAFEKVRVVFPWQEGDVLMLDNMMVAHGRMPFSGSRRVVVGMAEPWSNDR
jgi:alpha-ketoglutarate-dependent taurine dioxygenase